IPEAMINTEVNRMLQEFEQNLGAQGLNLELYYQFSGQDEAALRAQMKEDAEKRVRFNLTLEAIANAENLEASDEDVEKELARMSELYNMKVEDIKKALGSLEGIKGDLKIRKAIEFLVENSKTVA
ncbi:MAG: trigger factor, partial [Bacillus sp. (in: Bacteria)]|nr:trigger factor [Bacillus sp. (in: firmicutes)]